ncbi:hypothetical protein [Peribacillus frigoritolerans]|uniref:hypothetical protein n=1 Tax=Peribacillus frigoritolerans TaxID=450367 RepID=UPI0012E226E1|nr:hypothetical protein [Peribacillus frigoritolerans]UZD48699.1 hypothetical protein OMJ04_09620 [Peribacillus frigoritolerans]
MKNKLRLMFVLDYFKGLLLSQTRKHLQKSLPIRADQIAVTDIKTFLYSDRLFIA